MIYTGLTLFVFLALHLKTFKYGPYYQTVVDGVVMRDLHRLVIETFQSLWYVVFYVACMALFFFHLRHGFWSAFQSLGVNHPRLNNHIMLAGKGIAAFLGVGFLIIPIWIYINA